MAGLLYGWELGGGSSHLELARGVVAALPATVGRVTLALRHLTHAHRRFPPAQAQILQAPIAEPLGVIPNPASYAEILFESGYRDPAVLSALLRAWDGILEHARPDVIVADHAPTLLLASLGRQSRRTSIGAGFFCPPAVAPLPEFRFWERTPTGRSARIEARVLETINQVLAERGVPGLGRLADLFDTDENFLTTEPELDHYGPRAGVRYWGFYAASAGDARPAEWPQGSGTRVFAYLSRDYPRVEALVEMLGKLRWPTIVHLAGLPSVVRERLQTPLLKITDQWLDMASVMETADLVVCHAGAGTMGWALQHGCRLVTLPLHGEQTVAALRLKEAGLGRTLLTADPALFRRSLREVMEDSALATRLSGFQARIGRSSDNLARIGQRLAVLAAGG
jgi:hypothetical protein